MADWATPGNTTAATQSTGLPAAGAGATNTVTSGRGGGGRGRNSFVLAGLSIVDIGLSAMMAALGVLTILNLTISARDLSELFLSGYMIIFAVLLFAYEIMWWSAVPMINKSLRKNFGFLYGLKGKGLYLIFVAFLCLGLASDPAVVELTWATGIAFLTVGVLHLMVAFCQPDISDKYQAPSAGLEGVV